jgi:hypothetical protein
MMIVIWLITPLQSAIFTTGTVTRTLNTTMGTTASLLPLSNQTSVLNANFLNTAYGVSWLGQKLPSFSTKGYFVMPFQPINRSEQSLPSESWSTTADSYSTSLNCKPAQITAAEDYTYTFDDQSGCSVSELGLADSLSDNSKFLVSYIQYWSNPHDDYQLANPNCTIENSHKFLAIWGSGGTKLGMYDNMTALFCTPSYQVQSISVTVNASNEAIISDDMVQAIGTPKTLSEDAFNITNFEYIIGTGAVANDNRQNYPNTAILEQYPRILNYSIAWPVTNMVGFALANMPGTVEDLSSPTVLHAAFETAHQILFTTALNVLITPTDLDTATLRSGIVRDKLGAIIYVRLFSIIVEAGLGLVAFLTFCLWFATLRRPNKMTNDPSSVEDVMAILGRDKQLLEEFNDDGRTTEETLRIRLSGRRFRIVNSLEFSHPIMRLKAMGADSEYMPESPSIVNSRKTANSFIPIRPKELTLFAGFCFMTIILSGLAAVSYLFATIQNKNGNIYVPRYSKDHF